LMDQDNPHFDSLKRITDTVGTLELVINDILDGSQPASETKDVSDFSTAINKVLNLLEVEIQQRHISVNLNIQGNLPKIKIKEHHLFEIINNIVNNAIEAMEQNGLLLILANGTVSKVIITIQDTGPGIANENLGKIFKPFYTTREEGTGLGLVVIKKLVEENGGTVEVRSIISKGTTFIISFPVIK
ncbi:MAG: GHKL domain-containing protein, partial [Deltaproteobacteria bacterium]|nr:GHKL domain-containing protein [Deltaproteobacteria bacterium]